MVILFLLKNDPSLEMARGHASSSLKYTIILLIEFQILRFVSLRLQHREFVAPAKGGGKDLFEDKNLTIADYMVFVIYKGSWFGLFYLLN